MNNHRNEKLCEYLLNIDEDILSKGYEIDDAEKLKLYVKNKNKKSKKLFREKPMFYRASIIAASFALIIGTVLSAVILLSDNINMQSEDGENKQPYVVYGDSLDDYGVKSEGLLSRNEKYISPVLLDKMRTYGNTNVVYKVIVEIIMTAQDYNEFTVTDQELLSLEKQAQEAFKAYEKALAGLSGVSDESKRAELIEEINLKEQIARGLNGKYQDRLRKLEDEYFGNIINTRLGYATELSKTTPVLITADSGVGLYQAYKGYGYFMDLTAEDINKLAEKGGYSFRLASSSNDTVLYSE